VLSRSLNRLLASKQTNGTRWFRGLVFDQQMDAPGGGQFSCGWIEQIKQRLGHTRFAESRLAIRFGKERKIFVGKVDLARAIES